MCETTVRENTTDKVTNTTTVLIDNNKIEYVVNENANTETKTIKDTNGNDIIYTVTETKDDGTVEVRNVGGESFTYKYDKNDNITSISSSDEYEVTYEYDELEQLVRENDSKAGTTTLYSYDKGGNITGQKVYNYTIGQVSGTPIKTKNYEYGDSNWRDMLTSYNGQAITYDEIGNPLQYRDGMKMTWTNGRSLKSIIKGDLNTSYKYNKDGIRTQKTVNGKTTTYAVEDYNIVKETTDGENIWYMYDGKGDIVGLEIDGTSYYYDKNIQGDITGIYDTMGAKLVSYRYDAWGNVISVDGDKELASKNPFRYRGYYYDEEVGLYYLNSRYYDAETGRFVNADDVNLIPTMQSGIKGTNLFEYCDNNPVNKDDITGQWPSKKEVLKMLGKAWKFIWKSFWKIVDWIGRLQVLYSVFLPKSIKQKYTKKFIADQFVKLMTRSKARWFAFKNAVRTSRINWKIGGAIIVTLTVTVFTIIIYNCKHGIKAK